MKIKEVESVKPGERWKKKKCERVINSWSAPGNQVKKNNCRRMATFIINGKHLCTQHAGESCLLYCLKRQKLVPELIVYDEPCKPK